MILQDPQESASGHTQGSDLWPKDTQQHQQKERHTGQSLRKPDTGCQDSLPVGHTGHAEFPQQPVVTTHMRCCPPGRCTCAKGPRVFIGGWSHGHPLACTEIPDSRRKVGVQHNQHGLRKQSRHSEPLHHLGDVSYDFRTLLSHQVPRGQPRSAF